MRRALITLAIVIPLVLPMVRPVVAEAKPKPKQKMTPIDNCEIPVSTTAAPAAETQRFSGNVSWYGIPFHGKRTASGRIYDMNKLTCAHRTLPFGTKVLVSNPRNGKSVIVEVIDRGPYVATRVMDLSREAARQLDILLGGTAFVNCLVLPKEGAESSADQSGNSD